MVFNRGGRSTRQSSGRGRFSRGSSRSGRGKGQPFNKNKSTNKSGNASSYHTYTEVKKNFMLKVSVSLGEFGNDIKKALEMAQDVTFAPLSRNMIALPQGMMDPGTLGPSSYPLC